MFTIGAIAAVVAAAFWVARSSNKERSHISRFDDDLVRQSVVFAREDLRLVVIVLTGILIMLGIIADQMH